MVIGAEGCGKSCFVVTGGNCGGETTVNGGTFTADDAIGLGSVGGGSETILEGEGSSVKELSNCCSTTGTTVFDNLIAGSLSPKRTFVF